MYEENFLDNLNSSINLIELASEYTLLKKVGPDKYMGRCPNKKHNDKNPSFSVYKPDNSNCYLFRCFGCYNFDKGDKGTKSNFNYGYNAIAFYRWVNGGLSFDKAINDLCKKYNIPLPKSDYDFMYKKIRMLTNSFIKNIQSNYVAREYLYNRGLNSIDIEKWKIGYTHEPKIDRDENNKIILIDHNVTGKIVFPLLNKNEIPLAFSKRWLEKPQDRSDKYRNSSESKIFHKSSYFYGIHNIDNECDEIRITEGPMDVIMAHKYGAKNVVATLGTAFTEEHVDIIKKMNKIPVFIMDGDEAGQIAIDKASNKLASSNIYCKILVLPNDKDLCDISLDQKFNIENYIIFNSITYGQYKLNKILNGYESGILELKMRYFKDLENILEEIPNQLERKIIKNTIYEKMKIAI